MGSNSTKSLSVVGPTWKHFSIWCIITVDLVWNYNWNLPHEKLYFEWWIIPDNRVMWFAKEITLKWQVEVGKQWWLENHRSTKKNAKGLTVPPILLHGSFTPVGTFIWPKIRTTMKNSVEETYENWMDEIRWSPSALYSGNHLWRSQHIKLTRIHTSCNRPLVISDYLLLP